MKQLLNTLYVTTQGAYLGREDEAVVVRVDGELRLRVPVHALAGIVCFGQVSCSPALMELCTSRGDTISFLTQNGKFLARVEGASPGNVLLRREQYRRADALDASARVAMPIVVAKIANCRTVVMRAARDHAGSASAEDLAAAADALRRCVEVVNDSVALDSLRGIEGDAGRVYFGVFDHLIIAQKEAFSFLGRNRRPPLDPMNALLSFLYVLLEHDVRSALHAVGLDPSVGFLHRDRPGRPGLALDMMEEFRAFLCDRLALSLVNMKQVKPEGFASSESGAVLMDDETRKTVLVAYQSRKQEEIMHPFLRERVTVGLLPHLQARLLARHLRGDLDGYPPFLWK